MSEELRICRSAGSHSKAGPSVFYISVPIPNPHSTLKFPVKYTTFHVMHTNPAAISLSLNRAESLYLNSLTQQCSTAAFWRAVTRLSKKKKKRPWSPRGLVQLCFTQDLNKDLFNSTVLSLPMKWPRGGKQTTSHKKRIAHTCPQHVHRHTHTHTHFNALLVNNTNARPPRSLTAASPPQSSSEVKICYIMQPSIDFPALALCQLPAPKSRIYRFVPGPDSYLFAWTEGPN